MKRSGLKFRSCSLSDMERLDPKHQKVRLHILEASMNVLGDNDGVDGLLAHSLEIGWLLLDRCLVQDVCCRVAAGDRGRTDNAFSRRAGHASISALDVRTGRLQ